LLYDKTKVPYGIDYIDPWVRDLSNQKNPRAVFSQWVARILEPIAIKKASLISGVSTPYYAPAIHRNFPDIAEPLLNGSTPQINKSTNQQIAHVEMPYGFDANDHKVKIKNLQFPWGNNSQHKIWLYAGAFLPNSHIFMDCFFAAISQLRKENKWDEDVRLYFIGTGPYPAKRIITYAEDHKLEDIVTEIRDRFPFLHVLNFLANANSVMVIGSTEKHYTASKTYQSVLSKKPIISIFHHESSAIKVLQDCNADSFTVKYNANMEKSAIVEEFKKVIIQRLKSNDWTPDFSALSPYSAEASAKKLINTIEKVI
jgi:hypothetical protein